MSHSHKPRDKLVSKKSEKLFDMLIKEYRNQYTDIDDTALHIVNDIALLEDVKEGCRDYIAEKGVMVEWENGKNQKGARENPLLTKLNQTIEQQRKMLVELKLTPASRKIIETSAGADEFENF